MAQPLNELLCTLRLFHLLAKDTNPVSTVDKPTAKRLDSVTLTARHRLTTSLNPANRTQTTLRYSPKTAMRRANPPLQLIHHYRPICLQQIKPDSRLAHTSQPSPRSHLRPSLADYDPSNVLFLQTAHKAPKPLLRRRNYSPFRAARIVNELRQAQQAKDRRFDAIIADVTAELRLPEA